MHHKLAIIVPAYKADYLKETLESIVNQTDQRFNLYIFDDASPEKLDQIIEDTKLPSGTICHRFDENLGQNSIVAHWDRCVKYTNNESWIWLFSDDDLMDAECVSSFYRELDQNPEAVAFRFNTHKISDDGSLIRKNIFSDNFNAITFLNQKLTYSQESYIVETIFSRKVYTAVDGIPDLPLAWASDDMFNVKLALKGKIKVIQDAIIYWRYSEKNISGNKNKKSSLQKLDASRQFVRWIHQQNNVIIGLKPNDLAIRWYIRQIRTFTNNINLLDELVAVIRLTTIDLKIWKFYFRMKWDRSKLIAWLKRSLS